MDTDAKLAAIEQKLDELQKTIKSMRFYSRLTFWVSAVLIIGPLLLLPFAIPFFLSSLSASMGTTGGATGLDSGTITELRSLLGL